MAGPKAIVALVPMPRAAFTRYTQSESITTFAEEIYSLVRDQKQGYMVFTYVTYLLRDKTGTYVYDSSEKTLAPKSR